MVKYLVRVVIYDNCSPSLIYTTAVTVVWQQDFGAEDGPRHNKVDLDAGTGTLRLQYREDGCLVCGVYQRNNLWREKMSMIADLTQEIMVVPSFFPTKKIDHY